MKRNLLPAPSDFEEMYHSLPSIRSLEKHYGRHFKTITRWARDANLNPKKKEREVPKDFKDVCASLQSKRKLMAHYNAGCVTIEKWINDLGVNFPLSTKKTIPGDFHLSAQSKTKTELSKLYDVNIRTINKWVEETGVKPRKYVRGYYIGPKSTKIFSMTRPDEYGMAADFLRKFMPVSRCNQDGKFNATGKFYRVGSVVMSADDMKEKSDNKKAKISFSSKGKLD